MDDQDGWLAALDAMEILGISRSTLSNRAKAGMIRYKPRVPGSKHRLYHRGDVEALLAQSQQVGGGRGV